MRKIIILFLVLISNLVLAQNQNVEIMLQSLQTEKDQTARYDIIVNYFSDTAENNPLLDLKNAQKLLIYSQKKNDKLCEAFAYSMIGYDYRQFGNYSKSLEYSLKANTMADDIGNEKLKSFVKTNVGILYNNIENYKKSISFLKASEEAAIKSNYDIGKSWSYQNRSESYFLMGETDAALTYSQKDYELCRRIKYFDFFIYTLLNLGNINLKMGNIKLANSYYEMGIMEGKKTNAPKVLNAAFTAKAEFLYQKNKIDSSAIYARKAVAAVKNTPFANYSLKPAKLLLDIYRTRDVDSAFKYSEIYRVAKDSLFSNKAIQQTQLMTFEEDLRQQELAQEKAEQHEQNKENLQYIFIGIGILTLLILYLLLSRSFITNTNLIRFFGIISLLIVFEFINLLVHPFLERITHHSPIIMLLALVCIAALLVPLHHKAEHWATAKLIEKNKQIRLANAKKTIEKLELEK